MLTKYEDAKREGFELAGLRTFWPERWLSEEYLGGELTVVFGVSDTEDCGHGLLVSLDSVVSQWSRTVLGTSGPTYNEALKICRRLRLEMFGLGMHDDELDRPVHWLQRSDVDRVLSAILYSVLSRPRRQTRKRKK